MELKLNIPESLNDLTLEQYQNFLQSEKSDKDILKCFYGINNLFEVKQKDVSELLHAVNVCFKNKPKELIATFKHKGIKFGFIPNLDDISYGENIDLTIYINEPKDLNKAMAVLFRPIVKEQFGKYLIEPYEGSDKYSQLLKDMPLDVVLSAQVFFYNLTNDLLKAIPVYLKEQSQQLSAENGEAIHQYSDLLEENFKKLTKLQSETFMSA